MHVFQGFYSQFLLASWMERIFRYQILTRFWDLWEKHHWKNFEFSIFDNRPLLFVVTVFMTVTYILEKSNDPVLTTMECLKDLGRFVIIKSIQVGFLKHVLSLIIKFNFNFNFKFNFSGYKFHRNQKRLLQLVLH